MLKVIEFFAGIGSQAQALKNLGIEHEVIGISEIDKYAIKSYESIHGKVHNFGDITKIDKVPYADLWTYSFPCQDLSVAGKQAGIKEGTRSGLLLEVERLLESSEKPKYLLLENVKNLIGKNNKDDFERWLNKLEEMGYKNYYKVLNAKDYGIPQNRERVFVVSIRNDIEKEYIFPEKQELELKLKDMLESEVDEKYYLKGNYLEWWNKNKDKQLSKKYSSLDSDIAICQTARQYASWNDNYIQCLGMLDIKGNDQIRRVYDEKGISPTLNTMQGGNRQPKVLQENFRIRKLTPKECWRLMGFKDEQFNKAAFKKEIVYLEGGKKCVAKLKAVKEKLLQENMETYAFCTTKEKIDTEEQRSIKTILQKNLEKNEKMQNVNIVIEMLEETEQKGCAINTIKCSEFTEMLCTQIIERGQRVLTVILEQEKKDKVSTEKYMKITLEENLNQMKLFTILTLIKQIIELKIYTYIKAKANIQGHMQIIEDLNQNLMIMKLLNLKMEYTTRLCSDSALYKQAGNSICVPVLENIFKNLFN